MPSRFARTQIHACTFNVGNAFNTDNMDEINDALHLHSIDVAYLQGTRRRLLDKHCGYDVINSSNYWVIFFGILTTSSADVASGVAVCFNKKTFYHTDFKTICLPPAGLARNRVGHVRIKRANADVLFTSAYPRAASSNCINDEATVVYDENNRIHSNIKF